MTEHQEAVPVPEEPSDDLTPVRRLLFLLIGLLGVAAIALLVLIAWLLRPDSVEATPQAIEGCPMEVARSVYGYGVGEGELLVKPLGVAFDVENNLWVSDTGNARVVQFDPDGEMIRIIGDQEDPGWLSSPYGLAFSEDFQRLYVADWTQGQVSVFSADGRYVERFPAPDQDLEVFGENGLSPYDVAVSGAEIVVASNDALYFFDRSGYVVDRWGGETMGAQVGEFAFPNGVAIDPTTGNVYVADTLNRRIVALNGDGDVLWVSGEPDVGGSIVGFWQLPRSVIIGPDGLLYVTDTFRAQDDCAGAGHIVVLSPDGELVGEFGAAGSAEDAFSFPEKMATSPDGTFAIADREHNRAVMFTVGPMPPADPIEQRLYEESFRSFQP